MRQDHLPWFRCFPSKLLGAMAGMDADDSLVYVTLLLRIYETGGPVHESGRSLARRTGLTEKRAAHALWRLIGQRKVDDLGDGLIDSTSTHGEIEWQSDRQSDQSKAGKQSAKQRRKTADVEKNETSGKPNETNEGQKDKQNQQNDDTTVATGAERPSNHLEEDIDTVQKKPEASPEQRARESYPSNGFETWWERYPHKVGKRFAEKAYESVRKSGRASYPDLLDGLDRYIRLKPPDRPWCNPATWLNQDRWQDRPAEIPILNQARASPRRNGSGNGFHDLLDEYGRPSDDQHSAPHDDRLRLIAASRH